MKIYRIAAIDIPHNASSVHWNMNSTDMPLYDDIMRNPEYFIEKKGMSARIEWMTPIQYLEQCGIVHGGVSLEDEIRSTIPETVNEYAKAMQEGSKFPILSLEHSRGNQEGRHRAMAADRLGIDVPVLIVEEVDSGPSETDQQENPLSSLDQ